MLVEEEDKPEGLWKLVRVSSLITGKDGQSQGEVLQIPFSRSNSSLQLTLQHLYPFEVAADPGLWKPVRADFVPHTVETALDTAKMKPGSGGVAGPSQARPQRAAAVDAQNRLDACAVL